jgi:beta-lactamase class A
MINATGRFLLFTFPLLSVLGSSPARADEPSLKERLEPLITAHKGDVTVAIKNLQTGESYDYRAEQAMPTASLIKLAVMIEAYRQAADGATDLKKMVTLKKEDKVGGSGILTYHFSDGAAFPVRDAVRLMMVYSDNTATNLVLDQIGMKSTADTMEKLGYPNTKIHSKVFHRETSVFPERSKQFGLGSTTAAEMIRLCEALEKHELVNKQACDEMLSHMLACEDKDKFPRFLPAGTKVAFKTGSLDDCKTAAGILYTSTGPVALCVMTNHNEDTRWVTDNAGNRLCAEVARDVFYHFNTAKTAAAKAAGAAR